MRDGGIDGGGFPLLGWALDRVQWLASIWGLCTKTTHLQTQVTLGLTLEEAHGTEPDGRRSRSPLSGSGRNTCLLKHSQDFNYFSLFFPPHLWAQVTVENTYRYDGTSPYLLISRVVSSSLQLLKMCNQHLCESSLCLGVFLQIHRNGIIVKGK